MAHNVGRQKRRVFANTLSGRKPELPDGQSSRLPHQSRPLLTGSTSQWLCQRSRRRDAPFCRPETEPSLPKKAQPTKQEKKRGWGRPDQRSSDDAFSSFWPSELSPSLPSIGFLITRFWTIGAGALVGPGGDIGPRAWILRAGAPATTAPPLGGR